MIVGQILQPPLHVSTSTTVNSGKVAHSQILQGYILDKCKHQKWSHELKQLGSYFPVLGSHEIGFIYQSGYKNLYEFIVWQSFNRQM